MIHLAALPCPAARPARRLREVEDSVNVVTSRPRRHGLSCRLRVRQRDLPLPLSLNAFRSSPLLHVGDRTRSKPTGPMMSHMADFATDAISFFPPVNDRPVIGLIVKFASKETKLVGPVGGRGHRSRSP